MSRRLTTPKWRLTSDPSGDSQALGMKDSEQVIGEIFLVGYFISGQPFDLSDCGNLQKKHVGPCVSVATKSGDDYFDRQGNQGN